MTTNQLDQQGATRQLMALYYGFGRQDATNGVIGLQRIDGTVSPPVVDPINFSEFYLSQWQEFSSGACSFMPSVQDSWDLFRRSVAS